MESIDRDEFKLLILDKIEETKEEITQLEELTRPVKPDNAYGRLSRMDAINNKTINDAALRNQKDLIKKLERALERVNEESFGKCLKCGEPIPAQRLKFMPWTTRCVKCA